MQTTQASDAAIFGEVGGENYFLPLSALRSAAICGTYHLYGDPSFAQAEYAATFLDVPKVGDLWFTQYETLEYLWLGERAA